MRRKDRKGRILREGESQRKDGRYTYKYKDALGEVHFVYSWKLESHDRVPQGKRECISLREKEKEIQRDLQEGIIPNGGGLTVYQLVEKYISQKQGVKENTKNNYNFLLNCLKKEKFGLKQIDTIKLSDAKMWFIQLQKNGKSYGTIQNFKGILKPSFQLAMDDDLIRKNPFDFKLGDVIMKNIQKKEALTPEQEESLMKFIKNDTCYKKQYNEIYILFHTGLRISEFCGLTKKDVDFENHCINITHQLNFSNSNGFYIETPKSQSGYRKIPMTMEVENCFKTVLNCRSPKIEPVIDGYTGFVFLNKNGNVTKGQAWRDRFSRILKRYNKNYTPQIDEFSPHICRHTFCSRMIQAGMRPKTLQLIMGHSNISMTLDRYTHLNYDDICHEMQAVTEEISNVK